MSYIFEDRHARVNTALAAALKLLEDRNTTSEHIAEIADAWDYKDKRNWPLRLCLAYCARTPLSILEELCEGVDTAWYIKIGLVNNASCPEHIIVDFAHRLPVVLYQGDKKMLDKNSEIRDIARKRLGLPRMELTKEGKIIPFAT